jgi:hypothetical protein
MQSSGQTSTSRDPLVATLFAIRAQTQGFPGVVYVAKPEDIADVPTGQGGVYKRLEKEVALVISPLEFAQRASISISVSQAKAILQSMGFTLPSRIRPDQMTEVLMNTPRLTQQQIVQFVLEAEKEGGAP